MKRSIKNLLLVSVLSVAGVLSSCSSGTHANPNNMNDPIVSMNDEDSNKYFRNTIETIYEGLKASGTVNTTVFDKLIDNIASLEVLDASKPLVSEQDIMDICHEIMLKDIRGGSYSTNNLFDEEKYVTTLKSTNPGINFADAQGTEHFNKNYLIMPEDEFEDVFLANYDQYIEKKIKPGVMKKLLTAKYLYENSTSSLSRAGARQVQYIKLENYPSKPGAVNKLVNKFLSDYLANPTEDIDLDALQAIYKGIPFVNAQPGSREEKINQAIEASEHTLASEIQLDLNKILIPDEVTGEVTPDCALKAEEDTDKAIEDKYTGSGAYSVSWGVELAYRDLLVKDVTGDDLYTKTKGIADLPADISDRLFSASISNYLIGPDNGVKFLTPKTTLTSSELDKYYFFDSTTNAYYIVVVDEYYITSTVDAKLSKAGDKFDKELVSIAYELADSQTNERLALVHYLQKYDVGNNIHDDDFYKYIVDNYKEIVK